MRDIKRKIGDERGFALVVTLLVTAILVAVVVEFSYSVYVSTARAANFSEGQRAAVLAANGVELAGTAIQLLQKDNPYMVMGPEGLVFSRREGELSVELRVIDERARVSTDVVYPATGVKVDRVYDTYLRLIGNLDLDDGLVDMLADWIDSDGEPRLHGAEAADYYQRLPRPYEPGNGPLASFEELGMVRGYTRDTLEKLRPYVSPYNRSGLVNINTAPKEVIMALDPDITPDMADGLITRRKSAPFLDRSEVMSVAGFGTVGFNLQDKIVVTSDVFRVYSRATVGETTRVVEAVVRPGQGILYWRES
ncbi:MAG: type II secretion system minor pseudopilin GspK [Thermodesulfobacteriota bacterium]